MNELFRDVELRMKHAVDHFHNELKTLRTGRASLSILDSVVVEYYGTPTPLSQVANLSVADANLITAQPWDPSTIGPIERAIKAANLGLNPSNDGKLIRIPIPPLTEDRRKEFVRKAHDMAEVGRNAVRQARRDGNDKLKKMEKDKAISQDDERRGMDEVQKLHDHYIGQIATALEHKEKDILTL
jgi:ribosome recycling factor